MSDVDIANIQFDYDLVFAVMFMNGNGHIYSRYGGRTPWNSDSRVSLAGLKYTMLHVLKAHAPALRPTTAPAQPLVARDLPLSNRACIHCHEVWEGLRLRDRQNGDFDARSLFVYPRPENIGLTLEVDRGNVVAKVTRKSASERAGLVPGDQINQIGESAVCSQADVSWALHNAPDRGKLRVRFTRDGRTRAVTLNLEKYWKESNLTWRASMRKEADPPRHGK